MFERIPRWFQFRLEQFLLGGAHYRLLLIVGTIGLLSVTAGALVLALEKHHFEVDGFGDAVWWAFLRLTDPGYLGDDVGGVRRTISTALTVAGYVLFMGALVATMTQGLNDQIRRLERGFTPVALTHHVVIVGWTASTPELLAELTASWERVRSFLRRHKARGFRIAVLAEEVGPSLEQAIKDRLGDRYDRSTVILRSGSPLQSAHMERVDYRRAAVIVFAPSEQRREPGEASDDAQLCKAIVTLALELDGNDHVPIIVAAVSDPIKLPILKAAYPPGRAELFPSTAIVARMLARFARHRGLSHVIDEIFSQQYGSEIYVYRRPEFDEKPFAEVVWHYENSIVLGTVVHDSDGGNVKLGYLLTDLVPEGASLIMLAVDEELVASGDDAPALPEAVGPLRLHNITQRRLLIIGWGQGVPWLLEELAHDAGRNWSVCVASVTAEVERRKHIAHAKRNLGALDVHHVTCDCTVLGELQALDVASFETVIVLASDLLESAEDADARTLLIHQMLRSLLRQSPTNSSRMLVELKDPANADLFELTETEVIPSSLLVSHLLVQVALRPELRDVFDALLAQTGPEIAFIAPQDAGIEGSHRFAEIQALGARRGGVVLGLRLHDRANEYGGVVLNPARSDVHELGPRDRVIMLLPQQAIEAT